MFRASLVAIGFVEHKSIDGTFDGMVKTLLVHE
jgi:hypothetical protein